MFNDKLVVALIVARGGGSTFYRKNAFPVLGRPVLAWAIDILKSAGFVNAVFVWTEDPELADIAGKAGAMPLARPRDMVHYYAGNYALNEWHDMQDRQIREHLGGGYDYIVPFNCNCIGFRSESLFAMYERLRSAGDEAFRIQAVARVEGGLCLENPNDGRLFPFWNDTECMPAANPPLYRMMGVEIVNRCRANSGNIVTLYHEVPPSESFDFQNKHDVSFAQYYLKQRLQNETGGAL